MRFGDLQQGGVGFLPNLRVVLSPAARPAARRLACSVAGSSGAGMAIDDRMMWSHVA